MRFPSIRCVAVISALYASPIVEQAMADEQQVLVSVTVIDLNRTAMRKMGFDVATDRAPKTNHPDENTLLVDKEGSLQEFLELLKKHGQAKVIASPNLITCTGRPASFHSGGRVPLRLVLDGKESIEYKNVGTEVDCVATVTDSGRLRIVIKLRLTAIDKGTPETPTDESAMLPRLHGFHIQNAFEAESGQSLILRGLPRNDCDDLANDAEEKDTPTCDVERWVIVRPTILDAKTIESLHIRTAEKPGKTEYGASPR